MFRVAYNLTLGTWSVNFADDPRTEFIELEINLSLDSPTDVCRISVYAPLGGRDGVIEELTTQAAGALGFGGELGGEAFSVQVRGNAIEYDDPLTVELSVGDVSGKVMTGEVEKIDSSFGLTTITGRTGMQKLANMHLNQIYENQSLNQIVNDLAGQAGVGTGETDTGSTYSYFVVHESKSVLRHVRDLAMREGMDFYFDNENNLTIKKFNKSNADHSFTYGRDILDFHMFNHQMTAGHLLVYGESPASNQGTDTWHWITKDISPFQGEVGAVALGLLNDLLSFYLLLRMSYDAEMRSWVSVMINLEGGDINNKKFFVSKSLKFRCAEVKEILLV